MLESDSNPAVASERARPEDAEALACIKRRTWLATYPNKALGITEDDIRASLDGSNGEDTRKSVERWRQSIEAGATDGAIFVARVDGKAVGYTTPYIPEGQRRVGSLYVLPASQGRGAGRQLLQRNVDWHHEQDPAAPIYLHVASYNENAFRFYKKFGFQATGRDVADEIAKLPSGAFIPEIEMMLAPIAK